MTLTSMQCDGRVRRVFHFEFTWYIHTPYPWTELQEKLNLHERTNWTRRLMNDDTDYGARIDFIVVVLLFSFTRKLHYITPTHTSRKRKYATHKYNLMNDVNGLIRCPSFSFYLSYICVCVCRLATVTIGRSVPLYAQRF